MSPHKTAEDIIKLFAMSNQLVESELDKVESEHGIDLGRKFKDEPSKDNTYYPQFAENIRQEAAHMAHHYEIFYCLEKSIRSLITDAIEAEKGTDWWNKGCVPTQVKSEVEKRIQKEIDSGTTIRSTDSLDYTTFGELGEIIKANWDVFGSIFNSQKALEKVMANLNTLRGPIAHCSLLAEDEVLRLNLSLKDWFRLME